MDLSKTLFIVVAAGTVPRAQADPGTLADHSEIRRPRALDYLVPRYALAPSFAVLDGDSYLPMETARRTAAVYRELV
jgi:hypothetical protein